MPQFDLGAQLYIFSQKYDLSRDIDLILDGLANAGYTAVEGFRGIPADANLFRPKLEERNLKFCGMHILMPELMQPQTLVQYAQAMGAADLNNSGLVEWHQRSSGDYRRAIQILNETGQRLRDVGIHLHYHNHDFEFERVDGATTGMDLLLNELDFDVVDLCLDVGWVWRAGLDPTAFMTEHADKIGYLHLRDFHDAQSTELGNGQMNLKPIIDTIHSLPNVRWLVVEQDPDAPDPFHSMRVSRDYLKEQFSL